MAMPIAPATAGPLHPNRLVVPSMPLMYPLIKYLLLVGSQMLGWIASYRRFSLLPITCLLLFSSIETPTPHHIDIDTVEIPHHYNCHNSILILILPTTSESRTWDRGKDLSGLSSFKVGLVNWNWTLVAEAAAVAVAEQEASGLSVEVEFQSKLTLASCAGAAVAKAEHLGSPELLIANPVKSVPTVAVASSLLTHARGIVCT